MRSSATRKRILLISTLAFVLFARVATAADPQHDLMPVPAKLAWGEGALRLEAGLTTGVAGAADPRIESALARFRDRLTRATGVAISAATPGAEGTIVVEAASAGRPTVALGDDESYTLTVTDKQARITAPQSLGIFRGLWTLEQLIRVEGRAARIPAVTIEDRPRFPWRGLLIDVARHFMPVEVIKRNLDAMEAVKLNVLHWHLTDDQGFRVESLKFPKLHEQGSDGLFYSQEQIREIVSYARDRGIRVVPEFDVPGHSTSWLVGYPELGSGTGPYTLIRTWGVHDNNLDPTRDETYGFSDDLIAEMTALFPDEYFHIGGDEVTPKQWSTNPLIQEFMYKNGLRTASDLQGRFNARMAQILKKHGRKMVGWDEILRPDLAKEAVIQSWRGAEALAAAVGSGHEGLLSHGYYLDHMMPASFHYAADPIPDASKLDEIQKRRVLGGEACMWTEFADQRTIDSRIWPRAGAVAERLWSPREVNDVDDMYRRLAALDRRLDKLGLHHRSGPEEILAKLVEPRAVPALRRLAEVVTPPKLGARGARRAYTQATPLDDLVDAVQPESAAAREMETLVAAFFRAGPRGKRAPELSKRLQPLKAGHDILEKPLGRSPNAGQARGLSRDVSAVARLGLEALDWIERGKAPTIDWSRGARSQLQAAAVLQAELEIAILPAIRRLVRGAESIEALSRESLEQWLANRDAEEKEEAKPRPRH